MGLKPARVLLWGLSFIFLAGTALGAPKLRLSTAAVGPVSIAVGQDGVQQTVEAFNAGDGALALTVEASAAWLAPVVGAAGPCTTRQGNCVPIRIGLETSGLAKGTYTGVITVADPKAIDAPQTITVTVQMGGGVPDRADLYVAPNGSTDSVTFQTNSQLTHAVHTQGGGNWLSLALEGSGSFRFVLPYRIQARHLPGMGEGIYNGSVNITNSGFGPDIKTVPVTLRVTSQPIASLSAEAVDVVLAQDTLPAERWIAVNNRGLGGLIITGVEAAANGGGSWLAAELLAGSNFVKVTVDPGGLAPGAFEGTVTIRSNAVNEPQVVPVHLRVTPQSPPVVRFGGVVNNATFAADEPIPQGGIAALFGDQLSYQPGQEGTELPLVSELGGTKVFVNGQEAPLYYSSYGQVNFQMPYEIPPGEAFVQVTRDGTPGNAVSVQVAGRAPRLLRLGIGDYGIIVNQDGSFPIPATPGLNSHPAHAGDYLVIYAIGLGATSPAVASGAAAPAAEPLARVQPPPTVFYGAGLIRVPVVPFYAGLTPNFVGLYQINVQVPPNAPRGDRVPLYLEGGGVVSNQVEIAIE